MGFVFSCFYLNDGPSKVRLTDKKEGGRNTTRELICVFCFLFGYLFITGVPSGETSRPANGLP